jgi:GT2 family glycosyltransferase
MNNPKVSIVIPSFNTRDIILKNLPKVIAAWKNKENNIFEVIVVDDGSPDDSVKVVKDNFPEIRLIVHKKNRGFSCSVNTGARMSKGNLICLLNTDVIPDNDFLVNTLPHFIDDKVFAVSLSERGHSWATGNFDQGYLHHEPGAISNKVHNSLWASGGSAVFRRTLWMDLGGMDEKIFSPFYWEDIDLSYRAVKRGYKVIWEPGSLVDHKHESTVSKLSKKYVQRIRERNELFFIWKNIHSKKLIGKHIGALLKRLILHPGYIIVVLMALAKIRTVLKSRAKEMKEAKLSDEAVFEKVR